MKNRVVRQHYISKCYLDNFGTPTKKKNILWVCDLSNRWRKSRPEKEAFENDFQTLVDDDGNKSDALEKAFSQIEGDFKSIISEIEKTRSVPKNLEQLRTLLSVMGLFAIRIPVVRERFKNFHSEGIRKTADLLLKDKAFFESQISKARKAGYFKNEEVSYEKLRDFHQKGNYTIKHDHMWVLEKILSMAAKVTDYLFERNWMVVEAPGPYFITSSKPVNPFWAYSLPPHMCGIVKFINPDHYSDHPTISASYIPYNEVTDMFPSFLPGYGIINSIITFPITTSLALIGSWSPLPVYGKIDYYTTQAINWVTANSGADYVYSSKKLDSLPWKASFTPFLQEYHAHLGTRLIAHKNEGK